MDNRLSRLQKKALSLPLEPGVYIMRNSEKNIIYIGKAKKLKNRVSSYFASQTRHNEKVRQMVSNVDDFEYIICDSEFEALILEASLIKQNMPKYNILLKDDKGYHYIFVSGDDWRRISYENQAKSGGELLGPYYSSYSVRAAVDQAKKIYKLPQCNKVFSDDMKRTRPCLNHFIGLCMGVCGKKCSKKEYNEAVDNAVNFLKKGSNETVKELTVQMNEYSDNLEYEKAAKLRDNIEAIKRLSEKQKVVFSTYKNQDVISFVEGEKSACFEVFVFRGGQLTDREQFIVDTVTDENNAREQFIMQYYSIRNDIPNRVLVDKLPDEKEAIEKWLGDKKGSKVQIVIAQKGEQKSLIEMCRLNAAEAIAQKQGLTNRETKVLDELRSILGLKTTPNYIESYDISHHAGTDNVAGMIVFKNGRPCKKYYKRFAIKSFTGQDDYASMNEVLTRRFKEYEHKKGEEGFGTMPDLILLDGGKGQLNAVLPIVEKYGIADRTFGMVKDSHHKTRAVVGRYGEIQIKPTRAVFTLVSSIQDEVHRYAIGYHNKKASKGMVKMQLTEIDGVGPTRAKALLDYFKEINKVATASVEELVKVNKIDATTAENIYNFYHN